MEMNEQMKKEALMQIIQNANKLIGGKLDQKPAALMVDIKAAHPIDEKPMDSSESEMKDEGHDMSPESEEPGEDPKEESMESPEEEKMEESEEEQGEPMDKLEMAHEASDMPKSPDMAEHAPMGHEDFQKHDDIQKLLELLAMKKKGHI